MQVWGKRRQHVPTMLTPALLSCRLPVLHQQQPANDHQQVEMGPQANAARQQQQLRRQQPSALQQQQRQHCAQQGQPVLQGSGAQAVWQLCGAVLACRMYKTFV